MNTTETKFNSWCIVELFGHGKIAGLCSEQALAGTNFLRVDVPETKEQPPYTRLFNASAIYAINPVDEAFARMTANSLNAAPVMAWQADQFIEKYSGKKLIGQEKGDSQEEDDDFPL